ncbi:GAF domain-containing protein [Parasegetibacter sp. NRK P23]|uniref:GAF domain-containing protein n=1 Tax=Parasegetibacter sp. NRK P23 TaxID=2942999 RepID=UPI0020431E8A|nr:GAF domain-containing protein [Parasegetibacter sp. NRK P23]MCM5528446.1 GAF domain-containing protein [Parasegetibacter sp. NRK P23]
MRDIFVPIIKAMISVQMIAPPKPFNEKERLRELNRFNILDSAPEPEFDELVELASRICKAPISMISLVDENRQWFKSKIGFSADQTDRDISFCGHAILNNDVMVVSDTASDQRFSDNPFLTETPPIRFYAGAPIVSNGHTLGTICILDVIPRNISEEEIRTLKILAGQVKKLLELRLSNQSLKLQLQVDHVQKESLQAIARTNNLLISVVRDKVGKTIEGLQQKLENFETRELTRDAIFSLFGEVGTQLSGASALIRNLADWNESQAGVSLTDSAIPLKVMIQQVKDKLEKEFPQVTKHFKMHLPGDINIGQHRTKLEFILRQLLFQVLNTCKDANIHLSATSDNDFVLLVINVNDEYAATLLSSQLQREKKTGIEEELLELFFVEEMILRLGGKLSIDKIDGMGTMISFTFRN